MESLDKICEKMIQYYQGDPKRIQHFMKVHAFAGLIGRLEKLDAPTQFILEAAAYVHDIGIRPAEEKYGSCGGRLQEQEGPPAARELLGDLNLGEEILERICYLVGHHHTYGHMEGADYQILVEADFLVNLYEEQARETAVRKAEEKIFRTASGREILKRMFAL